MEHAMEDILLHTCCAPCSTYVTDILAQEYSITAFFYNPNIQPEDEYEKRLADIRRLCDIKNISLLVPEHDVQSWHEIIKGREHEPEGGSRCRICFEMRLQKTAEFARGLGFKKFATTLTISPHKNTLLINKIGKEVSQKTGVVFLGGNFKKNDGYKKSCDLSSKFGLYRQKYCGCLYSISIKGAR